MYTKFNKKYPGAYNLELNSNKKVWGVWFHMPGRKKKMFKALTDFQGNDGEGMVVDSLEKTPNNNIFLFEEDRVLSLN